MRIQRWRKTYVISAVLFILYVILMLWEIFIGPYRSYDRVLRYNLYPFATVMNFLKNYGKFSSEALFINLIGNIVTFIPLGFFMPVLFYNKVYNYKRLIIFSIIIIFTVEILQLIFMVGVFDVDDIILNTAGSLCGYYILNRVHKLFTENSYGK